MDKYRMRFSKTGRAIYTSHLDLMHTMQRAFNRAGYDLAYSEGFNPHPLISIALPLSVGMSSVCELMDFKLRNEAELTAMPGKLTAAMPEGIEVSEVYIPQVKASNIKWLRVYGVLEYDTRPSELITDMLTDFYSADIIPVEKKTKRGFGSIDIKTGIRSLKLSPANNSVHLDAIISAMEPTINPDLLVAAIRQNQPELTPDFAKFTRIETYCNNMDIFR